MAAFTPIPLTTVFTPPSTCTSLTPAGPGVTDQFYHEYDPSEITGAWTSCYPSGFTYSSTSGGYTDTFFSPGVCPSGFTMCDSNCISEHGAFWGLASSSETGGRCCFNNWSTVPYEGYCTTVSSGTTITALGIEVRWKSTDMYLYDPNSPGMAKQVSTTAAPTTTTRGATSTTKTSTSSGSSVQTPSSTSSASPTVIGGSVGAAFGVVIIALVTFLIFLRKRKRTTKREESNDANGQWTEAKFEGQGFRAMEIQHGRHDDDTWAPAMDDTGLIPPKLAMNTMVKSTVHIHELGPRAG